MEMEMESPKLDYSSLVDTSRPFSSVKEAVAVFGERILVGEIYSPKPPPYFTPPTTQSPLSFCSPRKEESQIEIEEEEQNNKELLKKMEWELEETKMEVKMLKEREIETEIAVATLNAELHKNMSKIAEAEANKAAAMARRVSFLLNQDEEEEEEKKKITNNKGYYFGRTKEKEKEKEKKKKKMKPVIPLVGEFFLLLRKKGMSNKKTTSVGVNNPLYGAHGFL